jgi:hypothetical protein
MNKLIALILFVAIASAAVDVPVLGLLPDREGRTIRPILGVPGAATVGQPVDNGAGLVVAAASREFAVGVDAGGAAVIVSTAGRRPLPGARPGATRIILSPSGSAAALYFASGSAQIFTGLPDAPEAIGAVELERPPGIMALSDDGATLLAVSNNGREGDIVYGFPAGQPSQNLYRGRRVTALAFVPRTSKAVIADGKTIAILSMAFGPQTVDASVAGVMALAASSDGSSVFAATRAGEIVTYDLRTLTRTSLSCGCAPTTLAPLRGKAVFRLTDLGSGPLWVLDADSPDPRIVFVPALPEGSR